MAKGNLERCLEKIWPYEGGFTNDRRDPGNWTGGKVGVGELRGTNMGIAAASFPKVDIRNITKAQAADIYAKKYAAPLRFDDLPVGPDLVTLDFGINSGIYRSARYAQMVSGAPVDGVIGPVTLTAIQKMPARDYVKKLCAKRLSFVQGLKIWETFGKGWSRRIAAMEATALAWVSNKSQLEQDAKDAAGKAAGQGGGAVITVGTGTADQVNGASGFPVGVVIAIVVVVAGVFVIRTVINAQRAVALSAAAKAA